MSSFHFESSLPSSQTDPVGDVDEIPEFENNFELENNTNLEEISVKKCDICQETIRNPKFKKHVKYCKLYFQFWTRTPTGFRCRLCLQVYLCQKLLFLHQLTHNITTDCSLNYKFNTWKFQLNMFSPCSPKRRASDKDLPVACAAIICRNAELSLSWLEIFYNSVFWSSATR